MSAPSASVEQSPSWARRDRPAWVLFGLATIFAALFFSIQTYWTNAVFRERVSWGQALYWCFGDWLEWALQFPVTAWMCRRFPFTAGKWPVSVVVFGVGAVATVFAHPAFCALAAVAQGKFLHEPVSYAEVYRYELATRTPFNLAVYLLLIAVWYGWDYYAKEKRKDHQLGELRRELVEAQLTALRMQLNPHFLFNTLNTVSALMLEDTRAANLMISRLGRLLRSTLDHNFDQEIALETELDLTQQYLEIEKVRFGPRLTLELQVHHEASRAAVPAFILQPLVENAIKHAVSKNPHGGAVSVRCHRENDQLRLEVADTGAGDGPKRLTLARKESIGLRNVRSRLHGLYGAAFSFVLVNNDGGGATARILLPFRALPSS